MKSISDLKKCIENAKTNPNYRITDEECDDIISVLDAAEMISNEFKKRRDDNYGVTHLQD